MPMQHDLTIHRSESRGATIRRVLGMAKRADRSIVDALYSRIVAAARQEVFYSKWNVPDTPLGRFEMLALHVFLFQHRLRGSDGDARAVAQQLIDDFFTDVEHSLRELGIGDLGVPKRMKKLAKMYFGRTLSYASSIEARDRDALAAALGRNIRPGVFPWSEAADLAAYVIMQDDWLARQETAAIVTGHFDFAWPAAEVDR